MKSNAVLIGAAVIGALIIMSKTVSSSVLEIMASAIRDWESGGDPNARNYRNNNPGNLRWTNPDTIPWAGAIGLDPDSHVVFDTYDSGWAALIHQLTIAFTGQSHVYNPSMTLYDFFSKYAEANPDNYARFVADRLGVDPATQLQNITVGA